MNPGDKSNDIPETLYVRKAINCGEKQFAVGDVFDQSLLTPRRVRQMWDQRRLGTAAEFQRDEDRAAARRGTVSAAKVSMEKVISPVVVIEEPEPVTAEDYDL